jgi:hypothetical protein
MPGEFLPHRFADEETLGASFTLIPVGREPIVDGTNPVGIG